MMLSPSSIVGITCPNLDDPLHGSISQINMAIYRCDEGYEIESDVSSIRICGEDKEWLGEAPVCGV